MPVNADLIYAICAHLERIKNGQKPRMMDIGEFTPAQFALINQERQKHELPTLGSAVITYHGNHHFRRRCLDDGYKIPDLAEQLRAGLSATATVLVGPRITSLKSTVGRADGYGNIVLDEVVLECTLRYPKAEAYSVSPKGDKGGPNKNKKPLG